MSYPCQKILQLASIPSIRTDNEKIYKKKLSNFLFGSASSNLLYTPHSIHGTGTYIYLHWSQKKSTMSCIGKYTSWWFQPIWRILVKIGNLPQSRDEDKKIVWNHHLVYHSHGSVMGTPQPQPTWHPSTPNHRVRSLASGSSEILSNRPGTKSADGTKSASVTAKKPSGTGRWGHAGEDGIVF